MDFYEIGFISSLISLLGIAFIITIYIIFPQFRKEITFRFVLYLSLSDLIFIITGLMTINPNYEYLIICQLLAFFRESSRLSSLLWTATFAYIIYNLSSGKLINFVEFERRALRMNYGFPLCYSTIFLLLGVYGPADVYCSISMNLPPNKQLIYNMISFYGLLYMIIAFNIICYIKAAHAIYYYNNLIQDTGNNILFQLLLYPAGLIICYGFTCIDRFLLNYGSEKGWLEGLHIFFLQLQGFVNAIVYGMNYRVRSTIFDSIKYYWNKIKDDHNKYNYNNQELNNGIRSKKIEMVQNLNYYDLQI